MDDPQDPPQSTDPADALEQAMAYVHLSMASALEKARMLVEVYRAYSESAAMMAAAYPDGLDADE